MTGSWLRLMSFKLARVATRPVFISLAISAFSMHCFAHSTLPPCPSDRLQFWHNCFGKFQQSNGDRYEGEYRNDKYDGLGAYYKATGQSQVGIWKGGKFVEARTIPAQAGASSQPAGVDRAGEDSCPALPQHITNPPIQINTSLGAITLVLDRKNAPVSAENFLRLVQAGHFVGTVFHMIDKGSWVTGGAWSKEGALKEAVAIAPVPDREGVVAKASAMLLMPRFKGQNTSAAQFFLSLGEHGTASLGSAYVSLGWVVSGRQVVERIGDVQTDRFYRPLEPIVITSVVCAGSASASVTPSIRQSSSVDDGVSPPTDKGINWAKGKCVELGFKAGTEAFGKCVLQLTR